MNLGGKLSSENAAFSLGSWAADISKLPTGWVPPLASVQERPRGNEWGQSCGSKPGTTEQHPAGAGGLGTGALAESWDPGSWAGGDRK